MNISIDINDHITFNNELFSHFMKKNPTIPACQREYINERIAEFYNKITTFYYENNEEKTPYLGIIHCGKIEEKKEELYILDGQHRFYALKKFYEENKVDFTVQYILKKCSSKNELKEYFRDLNNHFLLHEIILNDEDLDKAEEIKKYIKKKYSKHISKSIKPNFPNINLDQVANYLLQSFGNNDITTILQKMENINNEIRENIKYQAETDSNEIELDEKIAKGYLYEMAMKKNGFFLAYLFVSKDVERRRKIPKTVRDNLWNKSFNGFDGYCYVCKTDVKYNNFHAGHKKSVKNGGNDTIHNLEILCSTCNLSMGIQDMEEFKKKYFQ
jgi:hypothetical protein